MPSPRAEMNPPAGRRSPRSRSAGGRRKSPRQGLNARAQDWARDFGLTAEDPGSFRKKKVVMQMKTSLAFQSHGLMDGKRGSGKFGAAFGAMGSPRSGAGGSGKGSSSPRGGGRGGAAAAAGSPGAADEHTGDAVRDARKLMPPAKGRRQLHRRLSQSSTAGSQHSSTDADAAALG
eukprot:SAG22_NODE_6126_length_894_cov_1.669598_1_plen_175_part_10